MASSRSDFPFLIFLAILVIPTTSIPTHFHSSNNHTALFILGDSLFDSGNNNYIKNASYLATFPYGETFFKRPAGRFSDGRIIPDFIAGYMKLPLISPYLQPGNDYYTNGVNFASGGAGALVETYSGMTIDLKTQLTYFKKVEKQLGQKLGEKEAKTLFSRAIYLITIGNNDYGVIFTANSTVLQHYSREQYVGMVIGNITSMIKEIYQIGGRKFGFMNLGQLGCLPLGRAINKLTNNSSKCLEEATTLAKLHNRAFYKVLKELERELKGFKYSNFDLYTAERNTFGNPSEYGFKEGKEACCGSGPYRGVTSCGKPGEYQLCENPSEYVFFDGVHPTEKFNEQIAKFMWTGKHYVMSPYNLKQLFQA